jgi:hypothetical protein
MTDRKTTATSMLCPGRHGLARVRRRARRTAAGASSQDFHVKSPERYARNRPTCRRDWKIEKFWGEQAFRGIPAR